MDPDRPGGPTLGPAHLNRRSDRDGLPLPGLPRTLASQTFARARAQPGAQLRLRGESRDVRAVVQAGLLLFGRGLQEHDLPQLELGLASVRRPRDGNTILHPGTIF